MKIFYKLSIRTLLILVVVIVALPAIGMMLLSGVEKRNEDIEQAHEEIRYVANEIASRQESMVASAQQLMGALAQLPEVRDHDAVKLNALLRDILKQNVQYSNIFAADRNGTVWASAVHTQLPFSVADRRLFINALASGRFSSGEYVISRSTGQPIINFGFPFKNGDGKIAGIIGVAFRLDFYTYLLNSTSLPPGSSYSIIDYKGVILSRGLDPGRYVGKQDSPERMRELAVRPDQGTFIGTGLDGDERFIAFRKMRLEGEEAPYMYIRAGVPVNIALVQGNKALARHVAWFLFFLSLAIALACLIAKRSIVDRIHLLEKASEVVAKGNLQVRVSSIVAGGELGRLGESFDNMAQQLAIRETALTESERNYREIFNATKDAVFVLDAESGKIIEVNETAEEMFSYSREEIVQCSVRQISSWESPHSYQEAVQWKKLALERGPQTFEWLGKKKSGQCFWTEVVLSARKIGGNARILAVVRDISERQEMTRLKDEMISAVNHEMRTPLTAMMGYIQFILENDVDEAQMREYLGTVYKESERLKELVSNFLEMQRLRAKRGSYSLKELAVRPLLEDSANLFACASSKHPITVDVPMDLPSVMGDEKGLHEVLNNLLSNAIKYSPNGGEIVLGARAEHDEVTLWVRDNGIGIHEEYLPKVFDRFYRVDNTACRTTGGTGLGLALVREMVTAHGGSARVESVFGKGSTFFISLPACNSGQAAM